MALLTLSEVEKHFGADRLFGGVSFQIEEYDKVGLIGVNGSGKTTLFKMLLGQIAPEGGDIHKSKLLKIGYMQQHIASNSDRTVYEEVLTVFESLLAMEKELSDINGEIHRSGGDAQLISKQHQLNERFELAGGFTFRNVIKSGLTGLGFKESELEMPLRELSGGQQTRVMLCKVLLGDYNLLLLDEPTNHLDISSTEWLESFLKEYRGAFIVVSHDRYFLDKVTNRTFEITGGALTAYDGNYTRFTEQKALRSLTETRQYENTMDEIRRLEGIIKQQKQWNRERNIKTAESKQKIIDRLEKTLVKPQKEEQGIHFKFSVKAGGGNDVLQSEGLAMEFPGKKLFDGVDLFIKKQEKVFLLGPNGCGKTTLFRILTGQLKQSAGSFRLGSNIQVGYYDQTQQSLDASKTAFDEIYDAFPKLSGTEIRNAMAAFLFKEEDVFKKISLLSGGEKARVALIKIMLSGANFLLLDEPTNHLDISSREALEQALTDYNGTIFAISHDRYFINRLASRICYMDEHSIKSFDGNYNIFKEQSKAAPEKTEQSAAKEQYLSRKQQEAEKRKLQSKIDKTELEIERAENEIKELEQKLALPEYAQDYVKAMEITGKIENVKQRLAELYSQWEELV